MQVLQVKQYHEKIAEPKSKKALQRWRKQDNGYGYPPESMFFFFLEDKNGCPTIQRKNGYVAFNEYMAYFSPSRDQAITKFQNESGENNARRN